MTTRILHKRQLARRLRGFSFHFSLCRIVLSTLSTRDKLKLPPIETLLSDTYTHRVFSPSAITGKIKIKYVMQILKTGAARQAFGPLRVSVSVMMSRGWKEISEKENGKSLCYFIGWN